MKRWTEEKRKQRERKTENECIFKKKSPNISSPPSKVSILVETRDPIKEGENCNRNTYMRRYSINGSAYSLEEREG